MKFMPCAAVVLGLAMASCASIRPPEVAAVAAPAVALVSSVHFPTASDVVAYEDREILRNNVRWMSENPGAVLILEGHCDERGPDGYNMNLGDRRARSVMAQMMKGGVEADALTIVSYGERRPIDARHAASAWRRNRRVEFVVR